jgi:hypothetical protein
MKEFTVYKHPKKEKYQVNKVGFSWAGIIWNFFWCIEKRLFWYGSMLFLYTEFLHIGWDWDNRIPLQAPEVLVADFILLLIFLLMWFSIGFKGNKWANKKAEKRGFTLLKIVKAKNKKSAIALAKSLKEEEQEEEQEYLEVISENKECPMCAESVKARAKICRFCNYEFE